MNFRYFNYLFPVLILHGLALLSQPFLLSRNGQKSGKNYPSVLKTQIDHSQERTFESPKIVSKESSKKLKDDQPQNHSNTTNSATNTSDKGVEADLKNQYFSDLKAHIEQHKHYPMISRRLGQTGRVVVAFTLHEDGTLTNIHLHQSCPFERLNVAALDAVKSVGKFKPIPKEIGDQFLDIQVPMEYQSVN